MPLLPRRETLIDSDERVDFAEIALSDNSYIPDQWTAALLRGIERLPLSGKRLLDVGIGPGTLALALLRRHPEIDKVFGSDLCGELTRLAEHNIQTSLGPQHSSFQACHGDLNLLSWLESSQIKNEIDVAYSCLPQLKIFNGLPDRPDKYAHYYDPDQYPSSFDQWHLGLNDAFLREASQFLSPHSQVILILSGRPSLSVLQDLFAHNGFTATILHEEVMEQDRGSNLEQLVRDEQKLITTGRLGFNFYRDLTAERRIGAEEAWNTMQSGLPVFHRLFVMGAERER